MKDFFRNISIKYKIFFSSVFVTAVALLLVSIVSIIDEVIVYKRYIADGITAHANMVGDFSSAAILFNDKKYADEALRSLSAVSEVQYSAIYASDGSLFAEHGKHNPKARMIKDEGHLFGDNGLEVLQPIIVDGEKVGSVYVFSRLDELWSRIERYLLILVIAAAASIAVSLLILSNIQRAITAPILELAMLMNTVSRSKEYTVRAGVEGKDEVSLLAGGFNEMLGEIQKRDEDLEWKVRERTARLDRTLEEMASYERALEEAYKKLKDSEKNLIESAKMASLGEMGAGIAHELNSPLAGILSITEALIKREDDGTRERFLLEKIKDAAVRSKYIIMDLLTYSRPVREEMKPVYINETLNATLSLFVTELKMTQLKVEKHFAPDIPKVLANQGQLMEVFLNIIKNARDAMGGNGKIFIRTMVKDEGGMNLAVIEIQDTGCGIPDEIKDRIFDPFFTTKEKGGGLNIGLGLSISKSIVETHGGSIEFESVGSGTVFRVKLPACQNIKEA